MTTALPILTCLLAMAVIVAVLLDDIASDVEDMDDIFGGEDDE